MIMIPQLKTLRVIFVVISVSTLIVAAVFSWWVYRQVHIEFDPGSDVLMIEKGNSLRDFSRDLKSKSIIRNEWPLLVWAIYRGDARRIRAGEYRFPDPSSLASILEQAISGKVVTYSVTLIEGWTFSRLRNSIESTEHLVPDSVGMSDKEILKLLGSAYDQAEGLFFPDTYFSIRGDTGLSQFRRAYQAMERKLEEAWAERDPAFPLADSYAALILASIIEKEAAVDEERRRIAGVLLNRLQKNMPLQVDPTIIYGLGPGFDGDLTKEHLRTDGPYNTYTRRGLPPTPISNPSFNSLLAAVRPLNTTELFFVSRGDGRHEFSNTLEEHQRAIRRYKIHRDKRSARQL